MSTFDRLVAQIWGPKDLAAYSRATTPEEVRLKLLDVIAKSAFNNLRACSNCCRSTLLAVQTHLRLPDPGTIQASSALAGGIAGTGETCGSVLGGLMAIGQASETEFCKDFCFLEGEGALTVANGLIAIDKETQTTGMPGVFAGGDVANGPGAIIDAIAAGRRAALSIDTYLGGDGIIGQPASQDAASSQYTGQRTKGFADLERAPLLTLPVAQRHTGFEEVDLCYDDAQAVYEVNRCFHCDMEIGLAAKALDSSKSEV